VIGYLKSERFLFDLVMMIAMSGVAQMSVRASISEEYLKLAVLLIFMPMLALDWRKWRRKI
jgi:hypothetical protein